MTSRAESCPPKLVPQKNTRQDKPSAALQGAAQAFSARPANFNALSTVQSTANGAAAAAAAAGARSVLKSGPAPRPIKQSELYRPIPIKSPSHSAAQAASARASPQKEAVFEKISSEPTEIYASKKSPKPIRDPIRKQNAEVEEEHRSGRPWQDNTIAIPQPVRPLPHSAALTAILGLDPEISPGSTPYSPSPPAMTANSTVGISAARVAAKRATPAAQIADHSSNAPVEDTPWQSLRSINSLPSSNDGLQTSLDMEPLSPFPSFHDRAVQIEQIKPRNEQDLHTEFSLDSGSAASSAMKATTSVDESVQSAFKSLPKHAIAADAIIAWSVASSRAASPTKGVRPPTLRRRSKSFGVFHHHQSPSEHHSLQLNAPIHKLKHTLRKHHQADEDDEENEIAKRGRRHFIRKHQHKHHEGDRKRWRDRVTEKERKRYEGVWAANRGLFTFWDFRTTEFENSSRPPTEMDAVLNIVVRDVWERSRLPRGELEEVWDLVARENANTLRRDEFVVGLWLLDQRLKGRKLPTRVSSSVWASVRHTLMIRPK